MYGMNFMFGNNVGFGCFCRPMVNPFIMGAMQGYASATLGYAMMGGIPYTPSLFQFNMLPQAQGYSMMPTGNLFGFNAANIYAMPSYQNFQAQYNNPYVNLANSSYAQNVSNNGSTVSEHGSLASAAKSSSASFATVKPREVKSDVSFKEKVESVARNLNCKPKDLLALMNSESGLNPKAQNKSSGTVGLIQFTDMALADINKAYGLNLTKAQVKNMSAVEQMDIVEKFFMLAKKRRFSASAQLSAGDLYALTFLPGRAAREVLTQRGENFYASNRALDMNNDGKITKSDLEARMNKFSVSLVA